MKKNLLQSIITIIIFLQSAAILIIAISWADIVYYTTTNIFVRLEAPALIVLSGCIFFILGMTVCIYQWTKEA